jgi:small conductance mechanosensitive channel
MTVTYDNWSDLWDDIANVVLANLFEIGIIVVLTLLALRLLRHLVRVVVERTLRARAEPSREVEQKARTLSIIVESTGRAIILVVATLWILSNLGINITPLLASAGIVGLGISLGAQSLIRDMINGFLILFEDQFGVDDYVRINDEIGTVEMVTLRRTVLRSPDGSAVSISNGDVRTVENMSKGWSRVVVDMGVDPNANEEDVLTVFHKVLDNIEDDPQLAESIMSPPRIHGISAVTANQLTFRAVVDAVPRERGMVERELRRRLRAALLEAEVPLPPRTLEIMQGPLGRF